MSRIHPLSSCFLLLSCTIAVVAHTMNLPSSTLSTGRLELSECIAMCIRADDVDLCQHPDLLFALYLRLVTLAPRLQASRESISTPPAVEKRVCRQSSNSTASRAIPRNRRRIRLGASARPLARAEPHHNGTLPVDISRGPGDSGPVLASPTNSQLAQYARSSRLSNLSCRLKRASTTVTVPLKNQLCDSFAARLTEPCNSVTSVLIWLDGPSTHDRHEHADIDSLIITILKRRIALEYERHQQTHPDADALAFSRSHFVGRDVSKTYSSLRDGLKLRRLERAGGGHVGIVALLAHIRNWYSIKNDQVNDACMDLEKLGHMAVLGSLEGLDNLMEYAIAYLDKLVYHPQVLDTCGTSHGTGLITGIQTAHAFPVLQSASIVPVAPTTPFHTDSPTNAMNHTAPQPVNDATWAANSFTYSGLFGISQFPGFLNGSTQ